MIQVKVNARRGVIAEKVPMIIAEVQRRMSALLIEMQRFIVSEKLQGGNPLHSRTGNLARNINWNIQRQGNVITGRVGVGPGAPYGAALEFGADIPERVPVNAKALHWMGAGGEDVFAMRARAFHLDAHPFMKPTLLEYRPRIIAELGEGVRMGIE